MIIINDNGFIEGLPTSTNMALSLLIIMSRNRIIFKPLLLFFNHLDNYDYFLNE